VSELADAHREPERVKDTGDGSTDPEDDQGEEDPKSPWAYESWWEEPMKYWPTVRCGVDLISDNSWQMPEADVVAGILALSPLNSDELPWLNYSINKLSPANKTLVLAAQ
jgi:hypothetical protein